MSGVFAFCNFIVLAEISYFYALISVFYVILMVVRKFFGFFSRLLLGLSNEVL